MNEAIVYLNQHIAPQNFVSFSVFEDDHPCPKNHYHVVVYHKGDGLAPLSKPDDIQGEIYTLHQFEGEGWENALKKSEDYMIEGGQDFCHKVSAYNYTFDREDNKEVAVVSWNKHHADVLADLSRGGCQCYIF